MNIKDFKIVADELKENGLSNELINLKSEWDSIFSEYGKWNSDYDEFEVNIPKDIYDKFVNDKVNPLVDKINKFLDSKKDSNSYIIYEEFVNIYPFDVAIEDYHINEIYNEQSIIELIGLIDYNGELMGYSGPKKINRIGTKKKLY